MTAHPVLLQKKYVRIIEMFARDNKIGLNEALDFFYNSELYQLIREGCSDMHCMSDQYLVQDLTTEYRKKDKSLHSKEKY